MSQQKSMTAYALSLIASRLLIIPMAFAGSTAKITHFAETGTCENVATGARRCALTPSDCTPTHVGGEKNINGERWYSAYRMSQKESQSSSATPCTCEMARVSACFAGEAELDEDGANLSFRCAPNSDSCMLSQGEVFGHIDDIPFANNAQCGCNVLAKLEEQEGSDETFPEEQRATRYGACYKDQANSFCAFSPDDCGDDGYIWLDPPSSTDLLGYDCTCADAHIGGCVGGFMSFKCAVSEHDCTWDTYYPPMTLMQNFGYNCRLCKPFGQGTHPDIIDTMSEEGNTKSTTNSSVIAIISGIIGASIGAMAGVLVYRMYTPKKSSSDVKVHNTKVAKDVGNATGHDPEENGREIT